MPTHRQGRDAGVDHDQDPGRRGEGRDEHGRGAPEPVEHDRTAQPARGSSRPRTVANPSTPTQWRASYPSTSESASQSLAAPSARVNDSTISPIASVRGSSQADAPDWASSPRSARGARREAPGGHMGGRHGQATDDDVVRSQRYAERGRDRADARAGEGAEAPARVEAGHDAAPEQVLDGGPLDVHPDVPRAGAEAVAEQAQRPLPARSRRVAKTPATTSPSSDHPGAEPDDGAGAPPLDQEARWPASPPSSRPRSTAAGAPRPPLLRSSELAQVGHPRDEHGEAEPVERESGGHRVPGSGRRAVRSPRWRSQVVGARRSQPRARTGNPSATTPRGPARRRRAGVSQRITTWPG